ncbi:hypothetical protein PHYSODRAFT_479044, partial [Phytophthora sojae]
VKLAAIAVLASLLIVGCFAGEDGSCDKMLCTGESHSVCGSNGVTYTPRQKDMDTTKSGCNFFHNDNCDNGQTWRVLHKGMCRRDEGGSK